MYKINKLLILKECGIPSDAFKGLFFGGIVELIHSQKYKTM